MSDTGARKNEADMLQLWSFQKSTALISSISKDNKGHGLKLKAKVLRETALQIIGNSRLIGKKDSGREFIKDTHAFLPALMSIFT